MIPEERGTRTITSNMEGKTYALKIDVANLEHIITVLTDLYADPEYAIIREYSTNAYDAHIEAGIDRAIEVSTPTALRRTLLIRDFGVGLSAEDIGTVYSSYGASTKRSTNDQVGMLGLGCKSALTYTDQFTVTSIKDGRKAVVVVSRDSKGAGGMQVIEDVATDDPNMTEVSIPCRRENKLEEKAKRFFSYWRKGTVLLNGKEPAQVEGYKLTDDLIVTKFEEGNYDWRTRTTKGEGDGDVIVMGNVAYPAPQLKDLVPRGKRVVAYVGIGGVDFAPSREALMETPRTEETIKKLKAEFDKSRRIAVERDIAKADNQPDAALAAVKACDALGLGVPDDLTWKGKTVPLVIEVPDNHPSFTQLNTRKTYGYGNEHSKLHAVDIQSAVSAVWITDYNNTKWSKAMREKLDAYLAAKHPKALDNEPQIILTDLPKPPKAAWLKPAALFSWANDVRPWKMPGAQSGGGGSSSGGGGYNAITKKQHHTVTKYSSNPLMPEDIPDEEVFWTEGGAYDGRGIFDQLRAYYDDPTLVVMVRTRVDKFKREFPHAVHWKEGMKEGVQAKVNKLTPADLEAIPFTGLRTDLPLDKIVESSVNDPELKKAVRITKYLDKEENRGLHSLRRASEEYGITLPGSRGQTKLYSTLEKRYPLLDNRYTYDYPVTHIKLYVNAAYAAEKENA